MAVAAVNKRAWATSKIETLEEKKKKANNKEIEYNVTHKYIAQSSRIYPMDE